MVLLLLLLLLIFRCFRSQPTRDTGPMPGCTKSGGCAVAEGRCQWLDLSPQPEKRKEMSDELADSRNDRDGGEDV